MQKVSCLEMANLTITIIKKKTCLQTLDKKTENKSTNIELFDRLVENNINYLYETIIGTAI